MKVKKEANKVLGILQKLPKELNVLWRSCQGTGLFVPGRPCMRVRPRRLELTQQDGRGKKTANLV